MKHKYTNRTRLSVLYILYTHVLIVIGQPINRRDQLWLAFPARLSPVVLVALTININTWNHDLSYQYEHEKKKKKNERLQSTSQIYIYDQTDRKNGEYHKMHWQ